MELYHGDCLEILPQIPNNSVDMVLCDLPYGVSRNEWDSPISLDALWPEYRRVAKCNAAIVLTAAQPFTSILVCSNLEWFRYEWVWEKTVASGQLNVNRRPLQAHESVLVFYQEQPTYNQQFSPGAAYVVHRKANFLGPGYNKQSPSTKANDGYRHPRTVLRFPNPRIEGGHPTQKPVPLLEYLIKTYTNPGEMVLDNCMGSGSTGVAAVQTKRGFLGIEQDEAYFKMAEENIATAAAQNRLFV